MRKTLALMLLFGAVVTVPAASAARLNAVPLREGCKEGKKFAFDFASGRPNSVNDVEINGCYRRDKYRVVTEFIIYNTNGVNCDARGIVTLSNGYYHWRQYATGCS